MKEAISSVCFAAPDLEKDFAEGYQGKDVVPENGTRDVSSTIDALKLKIRTIAIFTSRVNAMLIANGLPKFGTEFFL